MFQKKITMMDNRKNRKMYDEPLYGVYKFTYKDGAGKLVVSTTDVKVIGETEKRFIVKLQKPIREHMVGDEIEVLKRNVKLNRDCTQDWWNKD